MTDGDFEQLLEAYRKAVIVNRDLILDGERSSGAELEAKRALVDAFSAVVRRPRPAPTGAHDLWQRVDNYARGVTSTPDETEPAWTSHLRQCRTCAEAFMLVPSGKKPYCDVGKPISEAAWKRTMSKLS